MEERLVPHLVFLSEGVLQNHPVHQDDARPGGGHGRPLARVWVISVKHRALEILNAELKRQTGTGSRPAKNSKDLQIPAYPMTPND